VLGKAKGTAKPRKVVEKALVLRTCAANMTSNDGRFTWPESGHVEAPDWKPTNECGNGLHGFLRGEGDGSLANWADDAKWLVVEVALDTVIDLGGKVKFPAGDVVFCGARADAISCLKEHGVSGAIIGDAVIAGSHGTATAGDGGTATAGSHGTATAGSHGTATAGSYGTATAGDGGILNIRWWDGKRYRLAVFYVGEDGFEPGAAYKADEHGKPVRVEKSEAAHG
jgi:hypothetical protein